MNKKIFDLFRYLFSIVFLIAMFIFSYVILSTTFKGEDIDENESFHNLPDNTMEVIVLGSSHAQYSFSPSFFYQETGLYSYVLGTPCQPLDVSYLMLKEALKTQSPKVVFLEVFTAMPLRSGCDGITCYITAAYQMRDNEKYETLKKLPKEKYETYVNPFISLHNDWCITELSFDEIKEKISNTIASLKYKDKKDLSKVSTLFGYHDNYPTYPVENSWFAMTTDEYVDVELKEKDLQALNDIYRTCKENNIELFLYKTPIDSLDVENLSYLKDVWDWADGKGIKYIDFVKESSKIDFQMCLQSDSFHSYINGASLITSYLSDLMNGINIKHVTHEELEKKYYDASNGITVSYLKYEYDPNKYIDRMSSFKGPMLIVYNGKKVDSKTINLFLNKYEISDPSILFVDDGNIVDRGESCVGIEYDGVNIYSDFENMEINGDYYEVNADLCIVAFTSDMKKHYKLDTNLSNVWKQGFNWYGE